MKMEFDLYEWKCNPCDRTYGGLCVDDSERFYCPYCGGNDVEPVDLADLQQALAAERERGDKLELEIRTIEPNERKRELSLALVGERLLTKHLTTQRDAAIERAERNKRLALATAAGETKAVEDLIAERERGDDMLAAYELMREQLAASEQRCEELQAEVLALQDAAAEQAELDHQEAEMMADGPRSGDE
jgi:hypothetical protein